MTARPLPGRPTRPSTALPPPTPSLPPVDALAPLLLAHSTDPHPRMRRRHPRPPLPTPQPSLACAAPARWRARIPPPPPPPAPYPPAASLPLSLAAAPPRVRGCLHVVNRHTLRPPCEVMASLAPRRSPPLQHLPRASARPITTAAHSPSPPPPRARLDAGWAARQAAAVGASSAVLGPLCDGQHSSHDVLHYADPHLLHLGPLVQLETDW